MKIVVDKLPENCRKCLFFVPGERVVKNIHASTHCRLTRHNLLSSDADKKRHSNCPLTAVDVSKK